MQNEHFEIMEQQLAEEREELLTRGPDAEFIGEWPVPPKDNTKEALQDYVQHCLVFIYGTMHKRNIEQGELTEKCPELLRLVSLAQAAGTLAKNVQQQVA